MRVRWYYLSTLRDKTVKHIIEVIETSRTNPIHLLGRTLNLSPNTRNGISLPYLMKHLSID